MASTLPAHLSPLWSLLRFALLTPPDTLPGLQAPGLQLGPHARFISDSRLFLPVSNLLESQLSKDALQVDPAW